MQEKSSPKGPLCCSCVKDVTEASARKDLPRAASLGGTGTDGDLGFTVTLSTAGSVSATEDTGGLQGCECEGGKVKEKFY